MKKIVSLIAVIAIVLVGIFLMSSSSHIAFIGQTYQVSQDQLQEVALSENIIGTSIKYIEKKNFFQQEEYLIAYDKGLNAFTVIKSGKNYVIDQEAMASIVGLDELQYFYPQSIIPSLNMENMYYDYALLDWKYEMAYGLIHEQEKTSEVRLPMEITSFDEPDLTFSHEPTQLLWLMEDEQKDVDDLKELVNGKYNVTLRAIYQEDGLDGQIDYKIRLNVNRRPSLVTKALNLTPGELGILHFKDINQEDQVVINGKAFPVHLLPDYQGYAFVPISYYDEVGSMQVDFHGQKGSINIVDKEFPIQYLVVDTSVESSTRTDDAYAEYNRDMNKVRGVSEEEALWDGIFIMPCEGPISTEFGERRYVNSIPTSYRHSGIDIAVGYGTPVLAPNDGKVVYSGFLTLTGHTIVIDHGQGIQTIFYHLQERDVEVGDMVKKGDKTGEVGSTGFSTGPHLHWTMGYYGLNVEPWVFVDQERFNIVD